MLDPDFWLHRSLALDAITNFFDIFVYWQIFSHSVSFECCPSALSAVPKQYSCIQSATSVLQQVSLAGTLLYSRWTPPDRELLTFLNVYDQPCHQHSCLSHTPFHHRSTCISVYSSTYLEQSASAGHCGTPFFTVLPMTAKCPRSDSCHFCHFSPLLTALQCISGSPTWSVNEIWQLRTTLLSTVI